MRAPLVGVVEEGEAEPASGYLSMLRAGREQRETARSAISELRSLIAIAEQEEPALAQAAHLNVAVTVAVVDSGGNLQTLARMDGATFRATNVATHKAVTAAGLGVPTVAFGKFAAQDPVLLATMATQPGSALLPGGIPITVGGAIAGAIGVAAGTKGEDQPIAEAGAAAAAASD
ncbi:heme-binding protein [Streptomyces sp. NBC_00963]|uniref:GlcG/HbpS family heme-binding protein n=1 Tax=Streptomyces sp. NBC_00963 TaxID=2903697 RepID=UPI00386AFC1A